MSVHAIAAASRRYGADPEFVVAGGGNTSWKNRDELYVKSSGTALATMTEADFVRMDRAKLAAIWDMDGLAAADDREMLVLAALLAARAPGEEDKRPSVETLLHDILPFAFVVHLHPALVNGLGCSRRGQAMARELFGDDLLWIPSADPGYVLSAIVRDACIAQRARTGRFPSTILLQNHGIFVAADEVAEIDAIYAGVTGTIASRLDRRPDFSGAVDESGPSAAVSSLLARLGGATDSGAGAAGAVGAIPAGDRPASVRFRRDAEIARLTASAEAFSAVSSPFTPDHIVYAGSDFLFVDAAPARGSAALLDPGVAAAIEDAWHAFVRERGRAPKLAALRGVGAFGIGSSAKSARLAIELFVDAVKIAVYAESFGGPLFMAPDRIEFINTWEAENYRSKISTIDE